MTVPLSLNPTSPQKGQTVQFGRTVQAIPPNTVKRRAAQYDFVLGEQSPGISTLTADISAGRGDIYSQIQRDREMLRFEEQKQQMIRDMVESQGGRPVNEEEAQFILGLSQVDYNDVLNTVRGGGNIMETAYARRFVDTVLSQNEQSLVAATADDPEGTMELVDRYEWGIARNEIVHSLMDEVEQTIQNSSWGSAVVDTLKTFVPFYTWIKLEDAVENAPTSSFLPGNNVMEQISYLYSLPPAEFSVELRKAVDELKAANPYMAQQFLGYVLEMGTASVFVENLFAVADVADLATGGTAAVVGTAAQAGARAGVRAGRRAIRTEAQEALEGVLRGAVDGSRSRDINVADIAEATGDFQSSAIARVVESASPTPGRPVTVQTLADEVPSYINPMQWYNGRTNLAREVQQELVERANARAKYGDILVEDTELVQRTPEERMAIIARREFETLEFERRGLNSNILDFGNTGAQFRRVRAEENPLTNTEYITIDIGNKSGGLFANKIAAQTFRRHKLPDIAESAITYNQKGGKWYITVTRDVPDALDNFKNLDMVADSKADTGFVNAVLQLGRIRTPQDVLSARNNQSRLVVTHGTQNLFETFKSIVEPIERLRGESRDELRRMLELDRDYVDKATGERGRRYDSIISFEQAFRDKFSRLPTVEQIDAYFAYHQALDLDHKIRSAAVFRDKVRQGITEWEIDYTVPAPEQRLVGKGTVKFEGKEVDTLPWDNAENANIAFYDGDTGFKTYVKNFARKEDRDFLNEKIASGYKVIQVADENFVVPGKKGNYGVQFVVTQNPRRGRLRFGLNYRPGGHIIYEDGFFIKQGQVRKGSDGSFYLTGDTSLFTAKTQREANRMVKVLEEARQMMLRGDPNLDQFVSANVGHGLSGADFKRLFQPRRNAKGKTVEGLDPNIPFAVTRSGQNTGQILNYRSVLRAANQISDDSQFRDTVNSEYNLLSEMNRAFVGERESHNLQAIRSEDDVMFLEKDGNLLDPYRALAHGATNMMSVRLKRDYTIQSAQDWVEQFHGLFKAGRDAAYRNPIRYLYEDPADLFLEGADPQLRRAAEISRNHILRFLGTLTPEESGFEVFKQKIAEMAYGSGWRRTGELLENWQLPHTTNFPTLLRTVASHLKLGLWNPVQLFVQSQTMANVLAISPKNGMRGFGAMMAMRIGGINFKMDKQLARMTRELSGWREDEFLEMLDGFRQSGWGIVRGDMAIIDDIANPQLFQSGTRKVLNSGMYFVRLAEEAIRQTAYSTAYLNWRDLNKGKAFDRAARQWVLREADRLSANMSAANNAVWQKGMLSIPTQFYSYQARLTEQFFGKRLTAAEKLRLFTMQSVLYGMPVASGGVIGVWPVYETLQAYLTENRIEYDDTVLEGIIDGIPSIAIEALTGWDMDTGPRLGSGGVPAGRDALHAIFAGDLGELADVIFGASGTTVGDVLSNTLPFLKAMYDVVNPKADSTAYPVAAAALMDLLENVTTVNTATRLWYAINTGEWITRNGLVVDEVTPQEAFVMSLSGVSLERLNDVYRMYQANREGSNAREEAMSEAVEWFRMASLEDDPAQRNDYISRGQAVMIAAGMRPDERASVFSRAVRQAVNDETFAESVIRRYNDDSLRTYGE